MSQKFSLKNRIISFKYAFKGLRELFIGQHNAQIHMIAMFAVIVAGVYVEISRQDWLIVILTIAIVLMAEAMNTAIEYLADACVPQQHPLIAKAKDIAAAGVLVCAIAALVVALFIFLL